MKLILLSQSNNRQFESIVICCFFFWFFFTNELVLTSSFVSNNSDKKGYLPYTLSIGPAIPTLLGSVLVCCASIPDDPTLSEEKKDLGKILKNSRVLHVMFSNWRLQL